MENQINPYETPKSNPVMVDEPISPVPATKGSRFLNFIIDYVVQIVLVVGFTVLATITGGQETVAKIENMPGFILSLLVLIPYYFFMEAAVGRTIGKLVTGTKVVNEDGAKATTGQIFGRTLARIIPFEAFSFLGEQGRGWHDSIPKTYVVKCR